MPYLKTVQVESERIKINVAADGAFYANVPDYLAEVFATARTARSADCVRVEASTLDELERTLICAIKAYNAPTITTEHVIVYNIASDVSFWLGGDGEIYPNGYAAKEAEAGGEWSGYGGRHATNPSVGGHSLTIGARAMTKTTYHYRGGNSKVSYANYYGENGFHLNFNTPAEKLNAWCSMALNPKACREIPYTDEAAQFFYDMMMGMAKLSRLIQERTGDEKRLLEIINSGARLLSGPAQPQQEVGRG